ncbi:GNAT family N-acetyltransferase [Streptomyces agglomeratus]|uniref:GNAT family N-acetyltransferase n=1 Tax=Streptomyces agglomeratus TaxID=285458 RepID=A0A1E5P2Y2_9ACTN|nr:GNAT family N-acetyltransferase [Streptomyces agglomeratus]OEJ23895.1 GNAT family N-acetyltransferase [Streptomyces agglomeratus]OEJ43496.1 GNAT family N-acetyltransferase [Streptomyces agglomeratus]OEJ54587.1 GNAT family N-acetyltransferase [Streptomyces agglomeratus]OEJ61959.1 GNAT family N-acetyltransferase [Streptomyces agglomeratus]
MPAFEIGVASADDIALMGDWAGAEGWNPGVGDGLTFFATDPHGFLMGRLDGRPAACVSVVRYGTGSGFLGFYITRPPLRGQGYGMQLWQAGMARLDGRNVGLDGVVEQQENYRKSGFRSAWNNIRYEGVPAGDVTAPPGVRLMDAQGLPFTRLAAYDRRFFPEARDHFLAAWISAPGRTALAAVRDGELCGFGVVRECRAASRIGPLYSESPEVAGALVSALAATVPGGPVAIDVPDTHPAAGPLMGQLGLTPSFETARMYTGPVPPIDRSGLFGVTSLELG